MLHDETIGIMKIALLQSFIVWGQVEQNLRCFDRKLSASLGCDLILLPEMFTSGCMMVKKSPEQAMAEKNEMASYYEETQQRMMKWAEKQNAVVAGSVVCRKEDRYYNRMVVAFPDGRLLHYDKRHCFRMGGENEHYASGSNRLVFEFRGVKIAVFICYDLRFPVWCRNTDDYDLAVFVANWPDSRRDVWNALLKARAIENQCYVAAVNCAGEDGCGLHYAGDSAIWDARGKQLCVAAEYSDEILIGECDLQNLHDFRRKFAVLEDRDFFVITKF